MTPIHSYTPRRASCKREGNVRKVLNGRGQTVQETHYYPYGMPFGESNAEVLATTNGAALQPYKYGGKEAISMCDLSFYDFAARPYDPAIAIFHTPDPLQEKYISLFPSLYCAANPINLIDPSGMDWVRNNETNQFEWMDNVTEFNETPNGYSYVGKSNDDILTALNIKSQNEVKHIEKKGAGMAGDETRGGAPMFSKTELNASVSASAEIGFGEPTLNNATGVKFKGVTVSCTLNQKSYVTNTDYLLEYKGHLNVGFDDIWRSALLRLPSETCIGPSGWISKQAKIFFPASEFKTNMVIGIVRITAGAPNQNLVFLPEPVDLLWNLQITPMLIQGKK